jgi:hypothetical protein
MATQETTVRWSKRGLRILIGAAAAVAVLGGAVLAGLMPAHHAPSAHAQSRTENPIVGAWTTHAVSTTAGIQANLLAFLPGGVVIHSASNFPQSAGIGAWYDAGDGTVVYTFIYRRMDKSGAYIGSTRVHARVTVADDGLSYDSPLYTELTDPDDNVISTGQGTSHATRLIPTPPVGSQDAVSRVTSIAPPVGVKPVVAAALLQGVTLQNLDSSCGLNLQPHDC